MALKMTSDFIVDTLVLTFQGSLNEYSSELDEIQVPDNCALSLDLKYLTAINSVGVRNFNTWIHKIKATKIIALRCPRSFVQQLNLVHGFLPAHTEIKSFYVTYYSEATGAEMEKLFVRGMDYEMINGRFILKAEPVNDTYGNPMELEDNQGRYFKFLENYE